MKEKQGFLILHFNRSIADVSLSDINQMNQRFTGILRSCLERIKKSAQQKTPVKTGRLREGFRIQTSGTYPTIKALVVNPIPYFSFIEYGKKASYKKNLERKKIQPNIPPGQQERTEGVRMLQRSIDEHRDEIRNVENEFIEGYLSLIRTKKQL